MSKAGLERKNFPCKQSALGLSVLLELVEIARGKWAEGSRSLQSRLTFEMELIRCGLRGGRKCLSSASHRLALEPASGPCGILIWPSLCHKVFLVMSETAGHACKGSND